MLATEHVAMPIPRGCVGRRDIRPTPGTSRMTRLGDGIGVLPEVD